MSFTLEVDNFRGLRHARWAPRGVCALVGPNGAGKTTLVTVPRLLWHIVERTPAEALEHHGGLWGLRHVQASDEESTRFRLAVGTAWWEISLPRNVDDLGRPLAENVLMDGTYRLRRELGATEFSYNDATHRGPSPQTALRLLLNRGAAPQLQPLSDALASYRAYEAYDLEGLRREGSQSSSDTFLHPSGRNALAVLRNWMGKRANRPRYDFVVDSLRRAFPDTFQDLEFEPAANLVLGQVVKPQWTESAPLSAESNGLIAALLHLTAVAGTDDHGTVAIDEFENSLHPFAIRCLTQAFREWSTEHDICVVLATHSPVVLDQFKDQPDHIHVMDPRSPTQPTVLTEVHDSDWLAHFSLGDLYAHDEYGAPSRPAA